MSVSFREKENIGFIEFDQPESKVNILTMETIKKLDQIVTDLSNITSLKALVILSKKRNCFIAGADIQEIERIIESEDGRQKSKAGQDIFNKIDDLKIPTLAVIDGVALGGGCELALACLYRVATFNSKVRIGLPEVNLGFVPGFGGTYRLPRIIGLSEGLKLILSGRPVDADKAIRLGLVDRLIPEEGLDQHIQIFINEVIEKKIKKKKYVRKKKKGMLGVLERFRLGHFIILRQARKNVLKKSKGFYPAPLQAIDVIGETFYCNRIKGMAVEADAFGHLAISDISKNLVHVFYMMEKCKKLGVEGAEQIVPQPVNHCGVLGAGVMGGGIAQLLSSRDIWVRLKDINYEAIAQGYKAAAKIFKKAVKIRKLKKAQANVKMAHITSTLDYSGFSHTDFVIEAVVEKMEIKKKVFQELSEAVSDKTILATNTSALSVTEMANVTKDPSKVIGFHFFNPVHRMPLIEVITTPMTSKETIVTTLALAKKLGKTPILVKDSRGFIVNRILLVYIAEAGRILEETGEMERIDRIITEFGMPMGPFLLSDEVGLDVGLKVMQILEESFGERYKSVETFEKLHEKKYLGKKSSIGFYIHKRVRRANPELSAMLDKRKFQPISDLVIEKRLIYMMINEAARCLEEGVVDHPNAIDVGMIFGTGFPPFRGGLLHYADKVGIEHVVDELLKFKEQFDADRFAPCNYLLKLKEKNQTFY